MNLFPERRTLMIITKEFIRQTACKRSLNVSDSLMDWLIAEYAIEPYDGFWEPSVLEVLIVSHHDAFTRGMLDTALPSPEVLWQKRCSFLRDFIDDFITEYEELRNEHIRLREQIEALGFRVDVLGNIAQ